MRPVAEFRDEIVQDYGEATASKFTAALAGQTHVSHAQALDVLNWIRSGAVKSNRPAPSFRTSTLPAALSASAEVDAVLKSLFPGGGPLIPARHA